jgi:hypothetical protein
MKNYPELANFQEVLLECLLTENEPQVIRKTLMDHPDSAQFIEYVENMDDSMITTAAQLIKKWH